LDNVVNGKHNSLMGREALLREIVRKGHSVKGGRFERGDLKDELFENV